MAAVAVAMEKTPAARPPAPQWERGDVLALAQTRCTRCYGVGLRYGRKRPEPCGCVLRAIWRACYARYRHCETKDPWLSQVRLEFGKRAPRYRWGRPDQEYCADFCLVAKRELPELLYQVFRLHFLMGRDWKACCRRIGIDRGNFFHAVYRLEERLGRVFRELEPYALFPLDAYFGETRRVLVRRGEQGLRKCRAADAPSAEGFGSSYQMWGEHAVSSGN
jgi:hypothetical protein